MNPANLQEKGNNQGKRKGLKCAGIIKTERNRNRKGTRVKWGKFINANVGGRKGGPKCGLRWGKEETMRRNVAPGWGKIGPRAY